MRALIRNRCFRFAPDRFAGAMVVLLLLLGPIASGLRAQDSAASPAQEGLRWGRMTAHSEVEFGWRQLFLGGNRDLYRSHVNLDEGLRLLGLSFISRYPENTGPLFDVLTYSMASWGAIRTIRRACAWRSAASIASTSATAGSCTTTSSRPSPTRFSDVGSCSVSIAWTPRVADRNIA